MRDRLPFELLFVILTLSEISCARGGFEEFPQIGSGDLSFVGTPAAMNLNSALTLMADGGAPPYLFELEAGDAQLDSQSGELFTSNYCGEIVVSVSDTAGSTAMAALDVCGDTLFYFGGRQGTVNSQGYSDMAWRSSDGIAWSSLPVIPEPIYNSTATVFRDAMWLMGGRTELGVWRSDVWRSVDGVTWQTVGNMPDSRAAAATVVFQQRLWVIGGYSTGTQSNVWSSADGASWVLESNFPEEIYGAFAVVADARLRIFGGLTTPAQGATLDSWWMSGSSLNNQWTRVPSHMTLGCHFSGGVILGGDILLMGGVGAACERVFETSSDGGDTWVAQNNLPLATEGPGVAVLGDTVFMVAGHNDAVLASSDGREFTEVATFPASRNGGKLLSFTVP